MPKPTASGLQCACAIKMQYAVVTALYQAVVLAYCFDGMRNGAVHPAQMGATSAGFTAVLPQECAPSLARPAAGRGRVSPPLVAAPGRLGHHGGSHQCAGQRSAMKVSLAECGSGWPAAWPPAPRPWAVARHAARRPAARRTARPASCRARPWRCTPKGRPWCLARCGV